GFGGRERSREIPEQSRWDRLAKPSLDQFGVGGLALDEDRAGAFPDCCLAGGARPGERVEHGPAGRGDESDEPAHQREGFYGRVGSAVGKLGTLARGGLGLVPEDRAEPAGPPASAVQFGNRATLD